MQQRIRDLAVVQLGRRGLKAMCHAALGACANVGFHTEEPVISLLRGRHLGISRFGVVLVDDGASIIVASASVSERRVMHLTVKCAFTSAKIASVSPSRSSRWRKLWMVVSSIARQVMLSITERGECGRRPTRSRRNGA